MELPHHNSIFNFFLYRSYTTLHSHQQGTTVPVSPHSHLHLLFYIQEKKIVSIQIDVRWYLIVILTCISLMIRNVEHFYLYLLVICISPLDKCLFKSFVHFKLGLLLLRFKSFYVFWILISYQISDFKYFFSFHGLPFLLCQQCLLTHKNFKFSCSPICIFSLLPVPSVSYPRNHCQI